MTAKSLYEKYRRLCWEKEQAPMSYYDFLEACVTSYIVQYIGEANRRIKNLNREVRIARHNFQRIYDLYQSQPDSVAAAEAHTIAATVLNKPSRATLKQRGLFE